MTPASPPPVCATCGQPFDKHLHSDISATAFCPPPQTIGIFVPSSPTESAPMEPLSRDIPEGESFTNADAAALGRRLMNHETEPERIARLYAKSLAVPYDDEPRAPSAQPPSEPRDYSQPCGTPVNRDLLLHPTRCARLSHPLPGRPATMDEQQQGQAHEDKTEKAFASLTSQLKSSSARDAELLDASDRCDNCGKAWSLHSPILDRCPAKGLGEHGRYDDNSHYLHVEGTPPNPKSVLTTYNEAEAKLTTLRAAVVEYFAAWDDLTSEDAVAGVAASFFPDDAWHTRQAARADRLDAAEKVVRLLATEQP